MRKRPAEDSSSEYTWRTPGPLAGRLEVPTSGAWARFQGTAQRKQLLENTFSSAWVTSGGVAAIAGPAMTAKSQAALAVSDLRAMRAVYATTDADQQAFVPAPGLCIIIDPVSAYDPDHVQACISFYAGVCPVILVDRDADDLAKIPGVQAALKLKLPSAGAIAGYLYGLLEGSPDDPERRGYQHSLTTEDLHDLGTAMQGLSITQVNQVAMDGVLSRLQDGETVDRRAMDEALAAQAAMRRSAQEAAMTRAGR